MAATISGSDRLSVFALGTNFAGGRSAIESSVLGQLQRRGYRTGYLGERMLAKAMLGVSYVAADLESDAQLMEQLSRTLQEQRLSLLIAHFRALDHNAHKYGDAAQEYVDARHRIDEQIEAVIAQLEPSDHVLVMGDHGHATSGRHAAGLDVTSYAAYFGPQFARKVQTPMLMTEHAAIWARIYGFSRRTPGWLEDYYAGRALLPRSASELSQRSRLPIWALIACVLLAGVACTPFLAGTPATTGHGAAHGARFGAITSFAASVTLMAALGAVWPDLRAYIWHSHERIRFATGASIIATAVLGSALLGWFHPLARSTKRTWHARYAGLLAAAIVFALPTTFGLGGPNVAQSWLSLGLFGYALWFAKLGEARRATQLALACLVVLSLLPVKHANYVLRSFMVYARSLPSLSAYALPLVAAGFLLSALVFGRLIVRNRPASWLSVVIGLSAAACMGVVPDLWFVVPCSLALPLLFLALWSPRWTSLSVACLIPAVWFFYAGSLPTLTPILGIWLLFALLPGIFRDGDPALRGALLLSLVLMSFRTAMGCRIAGVDFDFFFRFLPQQEDVTSHWMIQALYTTAKYMLPATFGILLARAHDPDLSSALQAAALIGRARVGMCLFFLGGLVVMQPAAGAAIVGDATQEAAFWLIVLAVLGAVSFACSRAATACQPAVEA
jgi:hypothetical protein